MPIISLASAKGGAGKTTSAIAIATELALAHGYTVHMLDADRNQETALFVSRSNIPGLSVTPDISEENIFDAIKAARSKNDFIVIDLPGGNSIAGIKAYASSHLVIMPCAQSPMDVRAAATTERHVRDASQMAGRDIRAVYMWANVAPGFTTNVFRTIEEALRERQAPIMNTSMLQYSLLKAMILNHKPPRLLDPKSNAAANVTAVTNEVLSILTAIEEGRA